MSCIAFIIKSVLIFFLKGDKLPPSVIVNKGLRVNQGQSSFLSRTSIDVKDDDTLLQNLQFIIITQPKMGFLENVKEPGKRIKKFMYEDLAFNRIKYVQDVSIIHDAKSELINNEYSLKTISKIADNSKDSIDFKISDGKNDASASLAISIIRNDNHMPKLKSSYNVRVRELQRVKLTSSELKIVDDDTADEQLKFIITHPPQYGVLEKYTFVDKSSQTKQIEDKHILINTSLNQTLNLILKFNQNGTSQASAPKAQFVPVNEFSMADVNAGIIYYSHRSTGVKVDRFGFIIYDGFNNMFLIDDGTNVQGVSSVQIFNVQIETDINQPPTIEKNIGLDYLYKIDGQPGRLIMRNELEIIDKDYEPSDLFIEIVRSCTYGILEHKDRPGQAVRNFSQYDINQNKIYFILKQHDNGIASDHFTFDVRDSAGNYLRQNRFDIKWTVLNFELTEISVLEEDGKARVHIKREGNLKQYSMVTCKTQSDTAKSNRDSKLYDFIHSTVKIEFNEDESYKACDIIIQKDSQVEPIESFFVLMEEPKYAIIGNKGRVKINILDKQKGK